MISTYMKMSQPKLLGNACAFRKAKQGLPPSPQGMGRQDMIEVNSSAAVRKKYKLTTQPPTLKNGYV